MLNNKKMFILHWPELNVQVRVCPIHHNQDLFDWFYANLPTRCVQTVTVVAGLQMYFQNIPMNKVPCNWIQEEMKSEFMHEYPVGTFMFFMTAGNVAGATCKAGWQTEPMNYPTWAKVIDEDISLLTESGWRIWESSLMKKDTFHAEFFAGERK